MKVSYWNRSHQATITVSLASILAPTYTGSSQGTIEDLQAELEATKSSFGNLLELLVSKGFIELSQAFEICGKHESYLSYYYPDLKVML